MTIALANCTSCAAMRKLVPGKAVPQPPGPDLGAEAAKGSDLGTGAVKGTGLDLGTAVVKGTGSDQGAEAVKGRAGDSSVRAAFRL